MSRAAALARVETEKPTCPRCGWLLEPVLWKPLRAYTLECPAFAVCDGRPGSPDKDFLFFDLDDDLP